MSIQVKAEFESVDAAEIASRYIRSHLNGIEHIHVLSRRKPANHQSARTDGSIGGYYNQANRIVYGATSDNKGMEDHGNDAQGTIEPELRRDAVLSVTVIDDMGRACASMMRSLGGLHMEESVAKG